MKRDMKRDVWNARTVQFEAYPSTTAAEMDALIDALSDRFYDVPAWRRPFALMPAVSRCNRTFSVAGLPWWLPPRLARRVVANIAARADVGGTTTYVVERCVL